MIMMDNSTYLIQPAEQHTILKNSVADDQQAASLKTGSTDFTDATLLNTNHNSNFFGQLLPNFSSPILRANGTGFAMDNLESRGVNALHRRAEQLKRWQEAEEEYEVKKQQKQLDNRNHANLINKANLIFKKRNDDQRKIKFSNSTLFLAACASSDYDEINRLLNNNLVDINVGNIDGLTALHHACIDDNPQLVEFLLNRGADVNCVDNEGWSPLHATASCDHLEIARLLLAYGADCKLANVDHELALDLAEDEAMHKLLENALFEQEHVTDFDQLRRQEEERMREDVLEMIRAGVYDNKAHKRTGATIIHVAACKGYLEVLQLLFENKTLKKQIDVNVRDNEGWTPLTAATYWTKPLVVELLLQNGADVNVVTKNNQTLEQLTDYDLILNLIATRREQLKKQETLRSQEESSSLNKSNAESETQRKAHAKRIRESRRSTQGISAEDVNKAKDQLLMNSTIINLSGNSDKKQPDGQHTTVKQSEPASRLEITKLETINEIQPTITEESSQMQSSKPTVTSLQKTSHSDSCEIVEVKSVLDSVDGPRKHLREFTRPYRPNITVIENDDEDEERVDQELKAFISLSTDDDKDELKNDVVLNLRRDSLNILQLQQKDPKKSVALKHKENTTSLMRVELVDDYQLPKISSTSSVGSRDGGPANKETTSSSKESHTVRRDISQDSLDEQLNGKDYIGINSTLNCSLANNGLGASTMHSKLSTITDPIGEQQQHKDIDHYLVKQSANRVAAPLDRHPIDKPHVDSKLVDRSQINRNLSDQMTVDRNVDKQQVKQPNEYAYKIYQQHPSHSKPANEQRNLVNSSNFMQPTKAANQLNHLAGPPFEVPVLIETPCTPEPPADDECSTESNSEPPAAGSTTPQNTNNSFDTDSENNLSKRKRTKRRMENQEEIDTLYNETMNTINPKYTRNIEPFNESNKPAGYLYNNKSQTNSPQTKPNSNGNALKLYKKVDEELKQLPNNSVGRSRPSSTNSYKSKDYPDGKSADTPDRPVNNEHPVEKGSSDLGKVKPPNVTQVAVNQTKNLDYKKMYEDLLVEFENFKAEVNKKEQDNLREQRKMQRKISELEEELVQMETVKEDNSRLKNENGALVRVISKLSERV